jgi:hypothetical protein
MASDEPRPKSAVVREQYDWTATSPSSAVVETISRALDCAPTSFGPLYEYVDPDALNTIVAATAPTDATGSTVVSFLFDVHEVAVHGNGEVVVRPNASAGA